ncbi:LIM domain kinase 1-like isoform X1 [Haliotis rufescens]|uniref:LIM domain kinase 1-like isoform X1 n=1 Tax=Haliotis rufescens TaxID=6454 RepID=UPI00201EEA4E|nr:LIM domain kinase 1-like isoform X1 [Haliotis rufescens]
MVNYGGDMADLDCSTKEQNCRGCGLAIRDEPYVQALGWDWHPACFRCTKCNRCLSNWYFEKDGRLYCRNDYWSKFGEACNGCAQIITGPVMVAGDHRYHPECFICCHCHEFIGDGETYALVERSKLFCRTCYQKVMKPLLAATPRRRKPHSIQLVEIPPTPDGTRGLQLQMERDMHYIRPTSIDSVKMKPLIKISELDLSPELEALNIGDRILEVNGTTVRDKTVREVDSLLKNTSDVIQITVERDQSPIRICDTLSPTSDSSTTPSSPEEVLIDKVPVRLRSKTSLRARNYSPTRRRSKSPSPVPACRQKSVDLGRSHSLRVQSQSHRVFRASDLIIGDVLGQGFFGQAIKVTHRVTGEVMVLKELFKFDEEGQKSFLHEVSLLRNLDHPCVLKFMGVLYRDKKLNLVTEFVAGGTLTDMLRDMEQDITWEDRIKIARDISSGMAYLHSMDIIHRDLNSNNCLVREDKRVVVADFGLAKIIPRQRDMFFWGREKEKETKDRDKSNRSSKKRFSRRKRYTVVGSPYWMAPEMMTTGVYDEKVDVFSYGIVVCEVISRVFADPEFLPRTMDFGLNVEMFEKRFCEDCPRPFFMLAVMCCLMSPDNRPTFEKINQLCEALHLYISHSVPLPPELFGDPVAYYKKYKINPFTPTSNNTDTPNNRNSSLETITELKRANGHTTSPEQSPQ